MAVYLECLGYSVEVPHGETVIGRDVDCGLRFNDQSVSRRHMRFVRRGDVVQIQDLRSTNGTNLNGRLIYELTTLSDGDVIMVGGRALLFRVSNDFDASSTRRLTRFADLAKLADSSPGRSVRATLEGIDRRRDLRSEVELRLVYTSSELEIEAMSRNLSLSGVFVCTEVLDPLETLCSLTLLVDDGPSLSIDGIVRRVVEHGDSGDEPAGLGIEFIGVGEPERRWLVRALSKLTETGAIKQIVE